MLSTTTTTIERSQCFVFGFARLSALRDSPCSGGSLPMPEEACPEERPGRDPCLPPGVSSLHADTAQEPASRPSVPQG